MESEPQVTAQADALKREKEPRKDVPGADADHEVLLPLPVDGKLPAVIPPSAQMLQLLESVEDVDEMKTLHDAAAAWEETTERMEKAVEEVARIAEFRLRVERRIGLHLMQTVKHGGDRARLHNVTLPQDGLLPEWLSGRMANWYRKIARIPEDVFAAYLGRQKEIKKRPSANGAIKYAAEKAGNEERGSRRPSRKSKQPGGAHSTPPAMPDEVLAAVKQFMDVDVLVGGDPGVSPKAHRVDPDLLSRQSLKGNVFVAECLDPESWLPKLATARLKGSVTQVVVVVPATTGAEWFKRVAEGNWACCFPSNSSLAVLYAGEQRDAFWATFHWQGAVMVPGHSSPRSVEG